MWKRIKRAIRIARRNSKARRQRKKTSEILLAVFALTNCGTLQELEYHTGYYAGTAEQSEKSQESSAARSYGFFIISARGNVKDLKMSNKKTGLKGGGLFKSVHWKSNLKSLYQKGGESQW